MDLVLPGMVDADFCSDDMFTVTIRIEAPLEEVYAFAANADCVPLWHVAKEDLKPVEGVSGLYKTRVAVYGKGEHSVKILPDAKRHIIKWWFGADESSLFQFQPMRCVDAKKATGEEGTFVFWSGFHHKKMDPLVFSVLRALTRQQLLNLREAIEKTPLTSLGCLQYGYPMGTHIDAPIVPCHSYIAQLPNLEEWTLHCACLEPLDDEEGLYCGRASAYKGGLYYKVDVDADPSAMTADWYCGREKDQLHHYYPTQLFPAEDALGKPGCVFSWMAFKHPLMPLNIPLGYKEVHGFEILKLKRCLEKKYSGHEEV